MRIALLCLLTAFLLPAPILAADLRGPARVIDGDTIEIAGARIRLLNMDAPEARQRCGAIACGARATAHLMSLVRGQPVTCRSRARDRYGRLLAYCYVGGTDLGARMVSDGHAAAYLRYSDEYLPRQAAARAAGLGMWANGTPRMPWDERARRN